MLSTKTHKSNLSDCGTRIFSGDFLFGGLPLRISTSSVTFLDAIGNRYPLRRKCWADQEPIFLKYRITDHPPLAPWDLFEGRKSPVALTRHNDYWVLEGRDFQASFHPEERYLEINGPEALYPLDLACLALWYACHPQGLIFHGAGLAFDETGWLCSGPSGVGKTTMTELFPTQALCDEFCGILVADQIQLVSLPFWNSRPAQLVLGGIYLLEHAPENHRWPLSAEVAFRRLASQVFWPYFDEQSSRQTFTNLSKLVHLVSVNGLGFRPTKAVDVMFEVAKGQDA